MWRFGRKASVAWAKFSSVETAETAETADKLPYSGRPARGLSFEISCLTLEGRIHDIEASPSHNIPSGTFALDLVLSFLRAVGCKTATLEDRSTLRCADSAYYVSLRRVLLLSRGVGWYEARGFRSALHFIKPGWQERVVARAMAIPVRAALATSGELALEILSAWPGPAYEFEAPEAPTRAALELLGRAETVVKATAGTRIKTLGSLVKSLSRDCRAVVALTDALLPSDEVHILKADAKGRPVAVPPWMSAILDLRRVEVFTEMVANL